MGHRNFDEMWLEAEARFEARTKRILRQAKPRTINDLIEDLAKRYDKEAESPTSKTRLLGLIANVCTCLKLLGGVAAAGASPVFGSAELAFHAAAYLFAIPSRIVGFFEGLEQLFREVSFFLNEFKIYRRVEPNIDNDIELKEAVNDLLICFVDICALSIEILDGPKRRKVKSVAKVILLDDDSGVKAELERFRRLVTHQGRIVDAITLENVIKSQRDASSSSKQLFQYLQQASENNGRQLDHIAQSVAKVQLTVESQRDAEILAQVQNLFNWLSFSPTHQTRHLEDAFKKRTDGTGEWFLRPTEFEEWTKGMEKCLLLHGIVGSGKTVLCAGAFKNLQSTIGQTASNYLGYYFFRRQSRQSIVNMLGSIVRSTCCPSSDSLRRKRYSELHAMFYAKYLQGEMPQEDDLIKFLEQTTDRIFIVIDALDECGDESAGMSASQTRRDILKSFSKICCIENVHLLVSCRRGPFFEDLKHSLDNLKVKASFTYSQLGFDKSLVNIDIEKFIEERLRENLRDFIDQYPEWEEKIRIRVKPDGMFLLVAGQLDILEDKVSSGVEWRDIERVLDDLPEHINGVYSVILQNIVPEKRLLALTALKSLICAQRPLRAFELQELLSHVYQRPINITETFPSLLVRRKRSEHEDELLEFAHDTSIREYLLSTHSGDFHIDTNDAHRSLARTCLAYLKISLPEKAANRSHDDCLDCPRKRRALEYAINNWYRHAIDSSTAPIDTTVASQGSQPISSDSRIATQPMTSQMAALILHIMALLVQLLRMNKWTNETNFGSPQKVLAETFETKTLIAWVETVEEVLEEAKYAKKERDEWLKVAALTGYMFITDLLLTHDASVDARHEEINPLMAAATQNYPGMIALLLGSNTDVILKSFWWPFGDIASPKSIAEESTAVAIARLLVDNNADPNARTKARQTALHMAAASNQRMVVDFLLDKVDDPSVCDYSGATALHWAAASGNQDVISVLVGKGADVNAKSISRKKTSTRPQNQRPTSDRREDYQLVDAAESGGRAAVVKLLDEGAVPTAADRYGSTALHWVACRGYNDLIQILIDRGADVNASRPYERYGKTPLIEAARYSTPSLEAVRTLLQAGAEPNLEDSVWFENRTALHEVASTGHGPIAELLLQYGADANLRDLKGNTPADLARKNGYHVVSLLLEKSNQGIDARGGKGETALHMATENGHVYVVQELLNHKADVNIHADNGRTVLHSAAGSGSAELFNLLLQQGADPAVQADNAWSVIHEAAYRGNLPVLEILLRHPSVLPNVVNVDGSTPLMVAATEGQEQACTMLLAQETTDINAQDWRLYTPLQYASADGLLPIVELLLKHQDIIIDTRELHYARTPLLHAARAGHVAIVESLLERDADPDVIDKFGWSPLAYAETNGHPVIAEMLRKRGARSVKTARDGGGAP